MLPATCTTNWGQTQIPLGPDNTLMFMTGPLVGTRAPSCGRHEVCAISPLTGIWGESNSGGFWGAELRFSGYDGIVIRGRSDKAGLAVHRRRPAPGPPRCRRPVGTGYL